MKVKFVLEKETKGYWRYAVAKDSDIFKLGTVYLPKDLWPVTPSVLVFEGPGDSADV